MPRRSGRSVRCCSVSTTIEGVLHHVGFTSALPAKERPALTKTLESLIEPPGFTGNAPGGPSRWATERSMAWEPLRPELVVEVRYDQVTGRRFRHGTALPALAARQGAEAMHVRPARARAAAVGDRGAVRRMSQADSSAQPLACRPRISRGLHQPRRGARPPRAVAGDGPRPVPLPRLDRQPEDAELRLALRFRRCQLSADRTHSRLAAAAARQVRAAWPESLRTISRTSSSPATTPAPASAGTRIAASSSASSASR